MDGAFEVLCAEVAFQLIGVYVVDLVHPVSVRIIIYNIVYIRFTTNGPLLTGQSP